MSRILRLSHRWMAPFFILILIATLSTQGMSIGPILQRIQQIMVLFFALTGLYLFSLPWWVKWRRKHQPVRVKAPLKDTADSR